MSPLDLFLKELMIGILEVYATTPVPTDWARGKCSCFTGDQGEGMAGQLE